MKSADLDNNAAVSRQLVPAILGDRFPYLTLNHPNLFFLVLVPEGPPSAVQGDSFLLVFNHI